LGDEDGRLAFRPPGAFSARLFGLRLLRPDPNARYVTQADWIAKLLLHTWGVHIPVIWPPARTRIIETGSSRDGFLFFSRLYVTKRPHVLLALARRFPKTRVTIAGGVLSADDPLLAGLRSTVQAASPGNVRIVTNPTDAEVTRLFSEHQFFIFPARWEHFGIVTVEAIQAGLIPLVHDSGGQREIVPLDALRFKGEVDMVEKAAALLATSAWERREMIEGLQRHVARGSAENYCREMILPLCRDLGLVYPEVSGGV
jgi:glycosyltransferase involved in cell wall biosynthesis